MVDGPQCNIDFRRRFSLPFGLAPSSLSQDNLFQYFDSLKATAELLNNTYSSFFAGFPKKDLFYYINLNPNEKLILSNPIALLTTKLAQSLQPDKVTIRSARSINISGFSHDRAALELQKKVQFDIDSESISKLPQPFYDLDSIRVFWEKNSSTPFTGTLGLDIHGSLPDTNFTFPQNPEYLLETTATNSETKLGELDRLLIRSPVGGIVRFEPYYHFKLVGNDLHSICQSRSGRLVIKAQKEPSTSSTSLFEDQVFFIEHIDRDSVAKLFYHLLVFQLSNYKDFKRAQDGQFLVPANGQDFYLKLWLPGRQSDWNCFHRSIQKMLRSWLIFLHGVHPEPGDLAVYNDIPENLRLLFETKRPSPTETDSFLTRILANSSWLHNLLKFLEHYYAPILVGVSWYELIQKNHLPTQTPFLQLLHDLSENWLLCYSGCPLGYPSKVYGSSPTNGEFPIDGLTTFEQEAVHIATVVGVAIPNGGLPLSLDPYSGSECGFCSIFQLRRKASNDKWATNNRFYTIIDWLEESCKGLNTHQEEHPFLSLDSGCMGTTNSQNHPLALLINYPNFKSSSMIQQQMDILESTSIEATNLTWWKNKIAGVPKSGNWEDTSPPSPPGPQKPFKKSKTNSPPIQPSLNVPAGLKLVNFATGQLPSGLDIFDLESAYLAQSKVKNILTGQYDVPIPVILALMTTEGIRSFAWLNRLTFPKFRYLWQTRGRMPGFLTEDLLPSVARIHWLSLPYGLDVFLDLKNPTIPNCNSKFDTVVNQMDQSQIFLKEENIRNYLTERLDSLIIESPPGNFVPYIWKITRRCHWAFIVLMLSRFQYRHNCIIHKLQDFNLDNELEDFNYSQNEWIQNHYSNDQKNIDSLDQKRKDFVTYYSMIYLAHNCEPRTWSNVFIAPVEIANRAGLSLRDYLLFKFQPTQKKEPFIHMVRFAIALDSYCRLFGSSADSLDPNGRSWGI